MIPAGTLFDIFDIAAPIFQEANLAGRTLKKGKESKHFGVTFVLVLSGNVKVIYLHFSVV